DLWYTPGRQQECHDLPEARHVTAHAVEHAIYIVIVCKNLVRRRLPIEKIMTQCLVQGVDVTTFTESIVNSKVERKVGHCPGMGIVSLVIRSTICPPGYLRGASDPGFTDDIKVRIFASNGECPT